MQVIPVTMTISFINYPTVMLTQTINVTLTKPCAEVIITGSPLANINVAQTDPLTTQTYSSILSTPLYSYDTVLSCGPASLINWYYSLASDAVSVQHAVDGTYFTDTGDALTFVP